MVHATPPGRVPALRVHAANCRDPTQRSQKTSTSSFFVPHLRDALLPRGPKAPGVCMHPTKPVECWSSQKHPNTRLSQTRQPVPQMLSLQPDAVRTRLEDPFIRCRMQTMLQVICRRAEWPKKRGGDSPTLRQTRQCSLCSSFCSQIANQRPSRGLSSVVLFPLLCFGLVISPFKTAPKHTVRMLSDEHEGDRNVTSNTGHFGTWVICN